MYKINERWLEILPPSAVNKWRVTIKADNVAHMIYLFLQWVTAVSCATNICSWMRNRLEKE